MNPEGGVVFDEERKLEKHYEALGGIAADTGITRAFRACCGRGRSAVRYAELAGCRRADAVCTGTAGEL